MKHKVFFTICLILISSCGEAFAKDTAVNMRASVDKKTIFIGDRIRYAIELNSREDLEVKFPQPKDNRIGDFEIKDSGKKAKKGFWGRRLYSSWYYITAYTVGKSKIPSLEVQYKNKSAKDWSTQKTKEITITVSSVLPKNEKAIDIKDIKGPLYFYEINWFLVLAAATIAVFFILFIIVYLKRRKIIPAKLPHEVALEELEAIKAEFSRNSDVKAYYVGISDCVRHYIERRFKLKAPEMTTEEFLISLEDSSALSLEQKSMLREFLSSCDLVKFAKYAPTRTEIESVFSTAKRFVDETKEVKEI